ncbi:MAG: inositol-3-phosphate synthase [Planctomycetes bacterium]|nr:inositol-3-phosphate synthase [Planctomycetota bacterium]
MNAQHGGESRRIGVWVIGARGAVATCAAYGAAGLAARRLEALGLVSEDPVFAGLDLAPLDALVFGGHEVRPGSLREAGLELARAGILPAALLEDVAAEAAAIDARIRPGIVQSCEAELVGASGASRERGLAAVERLRADLRAFRAAERLERVVVVHLASAEAGAASPPEARDQASFRAALESGAELPASLLYASAAIEERCPYLNFTPSIGASAPALLARAEELGVPLAGQDGKTGETLLKTVLAPMFAKRRLRVLGWHGYNMLGNRDGRVLTEPEHKAAKVRNKDRVLKEILGDPELHSHVSIDYLPSLGDWKTAMDFVHFEGFLGARMSLQFTWTGSDSALAAPLVIDLVRFLDLAARRGERGPITALASFFKAPLGGGDHDFAAQHERLLAWARGAV